MSRLEKIREAYLNQPISEFLDNDGNAREYAQLVFEGVIFGPGEDVTDPELGIHTVDDLAEAIEEMIEEAAEARQRQLAALEEHRAGTQFRPLDESSPTVSVLLKLPESLRDELDVAAQARGLNRSEAMRAAIAAWVGAPAAT